MITKNKRLSKCRMCHKAIDGKYKFRDGHNATRVFHLSCAYNYFKRKLNELKKDVAQFNGYKRHMILEGLAGAGVTREMVTN